MTTDTSTLTSTATSPPPARDKRWHAAFARRHDGHDVDLTPGRPARCRTCAPENARERYRSHVRRRHGGHDVRTDASDNYYCHTCSAPLTPLDEHAVAEAIAGRPPTDLTGYERDHAAARLSALDWSSRQIGQHLGCPASTARQGARKYADTASQPADVPDSPPANGNVDLDPHTARQATLAVCAHGRDVRDIIDLLAMLGLDPQVAAAAKPQTPQPPRTARQRV